MLLFPLPRYTRLSTELTMWAEGPVSLVSPRITLFPERGNTATSG